jgi:hypothetical protein
MFTLEALRSSMPSVTKTSRSPGASFHFPVAFGGVEGGMIAAFVAFGVPAGSAVIAVLAYRAISFWLPTDTRHRRVSRAALDDPQMASARRKARQLRAAPTAATRLRAMRKTPHDRASCSPAGTRSRTERLLDRLRRSR